MAVETLGRGALGVQPLASGILHDPGTVIISTLGTVTAGGPALAIAWTASQPQGDLQEEYRVRLRANAGLVDLFDSGWLSGTTASYDLDLDALELDVDDVAYDVHVDVRFPFYVLDYEQTDAEDVTVQWGKPHCTITTPADGETVTTPTGLTVTWSSTDEKIGASQAQYRVILRYAASDLSVYDSGWVASTATSLELPVTLIDDSSYEVLVQTKNGHGVRSD